MARKFWRKKVLLAKIEITYGVNAAPTGAANAILAKDISLSPMEGADEDRDLDTPYLGQSGSIPKDLHQKISFKVELEPSGTAGTAPAWGPLLRACAVAETVTAATSVVYNPISDNMESVSISLNIDGTAFVLLGGRGNCKIEVNASGIPYLNFEFTTLYQRPVEGAAATPDYSAFQKPRVASNATTPSFSIDGIDLVMRSFSLDLGNQIKPRFLIGAEDVLITDKMDMVEAKVEAVPLTTLNPFELAETQGDVPIELVHGIGAGRVITVDVPVAQMQRVPGLENTDDIVEWPLSLMPKPASGNDQWTITLT